MWGILSLAWSQSPLDTLGGLLHLMLLAGVFVLAYRLHSLDRCWLALCWGLAVSLPFAVLQLADVQLVDRIAFGHEAVGLFVNRSTFSETSALALIAAIGLRQYQLAFIAAGCVLMAGGREGCLMLAAAAAMWLLTAPLMMIGWRIRALLLGLALAIVLPLVLWLAPAGDLVASISARLDIWLDVLANVRVLGWGYGTFLPMFPLVEQPHNEFIGALFELGPLGALILLGVCIHGFCSALVLERCLFAAFLVAAVIWCPLSHPASAMVGALLAGRLCGDRDRQLCRQRRERALGQVSLEVERAVRPAAL